MEIRTEAKTYVVDMQCNACKEGWMRPTGIELTVHPPIYPHKCDKCGIMQNYRSIYPKLETRKWHEWD